MKRIFIAFAIEDAKYRDFLVGQARNESTPFEFVDMSVKTPWETDWESKCRTKIKGCDGVIALISNNTPTATGELFEVGCAYSEEVPVMLMYINDDRPILPYPLSSHTINLWSWENIKSFIAKL